MSDAAMDQGRAELRAPLIESLDARTRFLSALALILGIVAMRGVAGQVAALVVALALVRLSGLRLGATLRRLLHVEGFMIVLLILLPLTTPGPRLVDIGSLHLSEPGLWRALSIVLTVNAAVLTTLALLETLEPVRLGRALAALGLPNPLVHLMFFLVRYQSVFREEARRMNEAMRARGFAGRFAMHTWRSYGNLVGMLLVRSVERAERVDEAMRCRGFAGRFPMRASRPLTRRDGGFALLVMAILAGLVAIDLVAQHRIF